MIKMLRWNGHLAKRLVIVSVSASVFALSYFWRAARRVFGRRIPGTCAVLYFHAIRSEHRSAFARQLDILLRNAQPVRADNLEPLTPGVHHAVVTFDDGYQDVIENALPELQKRGIHCTLFVVTDALGTPAHWLTGPRGPDWYGPVMTADQLKSLSADLVTIGSHTATHPMLPTLNAEEAKRELSQSRAQLETTLNRKVGLFSFPYGAHHARLIEWCREAGYERVFTTLPALAFADPAEFATGRVPADPSDWPLEFRLKLSGAYRWMPAAFSLKRKLRATFQRRGGSARPSVNDCSPSTPSGVS